MNTRNRNFTTNNGTSCTVWNERTSERNCTGMVGFNQTVRTWVENNATGETVDVEAGCSFQAGAAAHRMGW